LLQYEERPTGVAALRSSEANAAFDQSGYTCATDVRTARTVRSEDADEGLLPLPGRVRQAGAEKGRTTGCEAAG
jgi:hypothetical protein